MEETDISVRETDVVRESDPETDIRALADGIYRNKVLRARKLSEGERLAIGFELSEGAFGLMRDGIRHQFPDFSPKEVEAELRRRLRVRRLLHEHGLYRRAED